MQSGISPRPGNWILERSLDGVEWAPWQFFALTDEECWRAFGVEPRRGKPSYRYDDEVICTSYFSALDPLQDGEIHVSLVNGRPGASGPSRTLTEFTLARYVRIRFRRLRILPQDQSLVQGLSYPDTSVLRRYFYSLQDLTIGGQCPCNGHAGECQIDLDASMVSVKPVFLSIQNGSTLLSLVKSRKTPSPGGSNRFMAILVCCAFDVHSLRSVLFAPGRIRKPS